MTRLLLRWPALWLLALVMGAFSLLSPRFLEVPNLVNIVVQSASLGILATGMTFVLLTAGIDLSVGSLMFVSAALAGKLVVGGWSLPVAFAVVVAGRDSPAAPSTASPSPASASSRSW